MATDRGGNCKSGGNDVNAPETLKSPVSAQVTAAPYPTVLLGATTTEECETAVPPPSICNIRIVPKAAPWHTMASAPTLTLRKSETRVKINAEGCTLAPSMYNHRLYTCVPTVKPMNCPMPKPM
eukprot:CAMPEP_0169153754 /NCGR_PEP_ID=MMETSP1015-20121227/52304_1 /TAXON_ID=342587 /ORGANISM="Karlodinium micrum, Strain CCMP2283" /LENGTH=123 /DNA_ID=CAMNT_0009223813 /DNA_START=245 /DNA_END=613 /DNA_ORIENTATION=+